MGMRDYEDMKHIAIPKEQEEMMNVICDAWDECRSLETCKECPDRPKEFMRMAMCTALKYTRKLIETGYAKQPTADVQEVRHGRWIDKGEYAVCTECGGRSGTQYNGVEQIPLMTQFCSNCGAKMDGREKEIKEDTDQ